MNSIIKLTYINKNVNTFGTKRTNLNINGTKLVTLGVVCAIHNLQINKANLNLISFCLLLITYIKNNI